MFGQKQDNQIVEPQLDIAVTTIPTDFYAGANPTITFKHVEKVVQANEQGLLTPADKKALDKATAVGSGQELHPANVLGNRKKLFLIGGGLFSLFVAGAGGYYWLQNKPTAPTTNQTPIAIVPTPVDVEVPSTTPFVAPATTTEQIPVVVTNPDSSIEFPALLLSKSFDLDNDGLTDLEEEMYKSDSGNPDTDSDGYLDGSEVFHLYNPIGKEPIKLIESEVVKEFTNPSFGYTLYYPISWVAGNVDQEYRDMLFNSVNGENVEVRVFDKQSAMTFADWFAVHASDQKYGDLNDFETRFGDKGSRRYDKLVYYFATPNRVFVLVYHPTIGASTINYAATIEMMARSFTVSGQSFDVIPLQTALTSPVTEIPSEPIGITQTTPETTIDDSAATTTVAADSIDSTSTSTTL